MQASTLCFPPPVSLCVTHPIALSDLALRTRPEMPCSNTVKILSVNTSFHILPTMSRPCLSLATPALLLARRLQPPS